jgi:hypothetical protein
MIYVKRYKFKYMSVIVEAVQYDGTLACATDIYEWLDDKPDDTYSQLEHITHGAMWVPYFEGTIKTDPGDWVIKQIIPLGENYSIKPEIFESGIQEIINIH